MTSKNPHAVALGRKGGRVMSERKRAALARNGAKGGRPKVMEPCWRCGKVLSAVERRKACPKH